MGSCSQFYKRVNEGSTAQTREHWHFLSLQWAWWGEGVVEGRCPEKVPEISPFITPGSHTSLKKGIRLYAVPKLLVFFCWECHQLQRKRSVYNELEREQHWPFYWFPPLSVYLLSHMTLSNRDVFLERPRLWTFFPASLSSSLSPHLIYPHQALHLAEGTPFTSVISAIRSYMKKKLSNMIPLTHCWSNKFIRDIGMRNEREVKQFQLIVCLSFILLIRFTHHAYTSQ